MELYKEELNKDIQCKTMMKQNEKKLGEIEFQGATKLQELFEKEDVEEESEEKKEDVPKEPTEQKKGTEKAKEKEKEKEVVVEAAPDPKMSKLAEILNRKQKKSDDLLKKIEAIQSNPNDKRLKSLENYKTALGPSGIKMNKDGKVIQLNSNDVKQIIQEARPEEKVRRSFENPSATLKRNKSEEKFGRMSTDKAQTIAYERYLSQLESQQKEEQKRIMDTLKREKEFIKEVKQKEKKIRQQKLLYKNIVLDQIKNRKEKEGLEIKTSRGIPDIAGKEGYPPIPEPSIEQKTKRKMLEYKKQKDIWIQQVFFV